MERVYIESKEYKGINFVEKGLAAGEYENCTFHACILSNLVLSDIRFLDCKFEECDLSLAKISGTSFQNVKFKNSKLLGMHFDECNKFLFSVSFDACQLNLSSFYKLTLKNMISNNCELKEVDFTEANLTNSIFNNCNLYGAIFENTILEKADFRNSYNFIIDPEINKIRNSKFSLNTIGGLLNKYDIEID